MGILKKWSSITLVQRIIIGLVVGTVLAFLLPGGNALIELPGTLFVGALKAIAPVLVFFLVINAISQHKSGNKKQMKSIIFLYLLGTLSAAVVAVILSFMFPVTLTLAQSSIDTTPPSGIGAVIGNLFLNVVDNPVHALATANYIGILAWALIFGIALKNSAETTKQTFANIADAVSQVVRWIIEFAPFGIMAIVYLNISHNGIAAFSEYVDLLILLVGAMLIVALGVNPLIAFIVLKKNPYPLILRSLKVSGITAFFTRSSAANIPVNMELCEDLGLNKDFYSVSIPLGATINMAGAAITITTLTLATVHTLGINVDMGSALMLSIIAAISASGASGVAGGSLLLIPLAAELFGIQSDIAMQVVAVGFIIGVIQDSCETGLNSSTDVIFTAVAEYKQWQNEDKEFEIGAVKE